MSEPDLGPRKTMFVIVIVVGCFAVLWPKVFYPMLVGPTYKNSDLEHGCCDVFSETDVNMIKKISELCDIITQPVDGNKILTNQEIAVNCRNAVLNKCGIDLSGILKENVHLNRAVKSILEKIRSLNGSLCLKYQFGISPWILGVPHKTSTNFTVYSVRQERPAHLRPEMLHPALRERGRAIPPSSAPLKTSPTPKIVEGKPRPIPGMRPPMGGAGHVVPPSHKGSSISVIMPIYTIGIVIFFAYTLMKVIFKKKPEGPGLGLYPPVEPDRLFRKEVFESEKSQLKSKYGRDLSGKLGWEDRDARDEELDLLRRRLRETELAMERIMAQMSQVPLGSQNHTSNGSLPGNKQDQTSVKVLGMETTASCEGGQKWNRSDSPIIPAAVTPHTEEPKPQEIYLEGSLPAQSQLLVSDSKTETQQNTDDSVSDPAVVLASKMTLSVISLDSLPETENGSSSSSGKDREEYEFISKSDLNSQNCENEPDFQENLVELNDNDQYQSDHTIKTENRNLEQDKMINEELDIDESKEEAFDSLAKNIDYLQNDGDQTNTENQLDDNNQMERLDDKTTETNENETENVESEKVEMLNQNLASLQGASDEGEPSEEPEIKEQQKSSIQSQSNEINFIETDLEKGDSDKKVYLIEDGTSDEKLEENTEKNDNEQQIVLDYGSNKQETNELLSKTLIPQNFDDGSEEDKLISAINVQASDRNTEEHEKIEDSNFEGSSSNLEITNTADNDNIASNEKNSILINDDIKISSDSKFTLPEVPPEQQIVLDYGSNKQETNELLSKTLIQQNFNDGSEENKLISAINVQASDSNTEEHEKIEDSNFEGSSSNLEITNTADNDNIASNEKNSILINDDIKISSDSKFTLPEVPPLSDEEILSKYVAHIGKNIESKISEDKSDKIPVTENNQQFKVSSGGDIIEEHFFTLDGSPVTGDSGDDVLVVEEIVELSDDEYDKLEREIEEKERLENEKRKAEADKKLEKVVENLTASLESAKDFVKDIKDESELPVTDLDEEDDLNDFDFNAELERIKREMSAYGIEVEDESEINDSEKENPKSKN